MSAPRFPYHVTLSNGRTGEANVRQYTRYYSDFLSALADGKQLAEAEGFDYAAVTPLTPAEARTKGLPWSVEPTL